MPQSTGADDDGRTSEGGAASHDRAAWMSALATADAADLAAIEASALPPDAVWLRRPETGLVMTRGRAGGTGLQFNLGEVATTRCAVRLDDDVVGVAYVLGRDPQHAQRAAVLDARLQQAEAAGTLDSAWARWIAPLIEARRARHARQRARTEATRVAFFTVVRGEDA